MTAAKEVVLPSGRFARVSPITTRVLAMAYDANLYTFQAKLAAELSTVDGKRVSLQEILDADYVEWAPVFELIAQQLGRANQLRGGIA